MIDKSKLDEAFNAEIARVSTLEYNAQAICRHFYAKLRERLATTASTEPPVATPAGQHQSTDESKRPAFEEWFAAHARATYARPFGKVIDGSRYESVETEYAWHGYLAGFADASTEPAAKNVAAFGLFAEVEGKMVLQHPVRFNADDAEFDKRMYDKNLRLEVRPLFDLTVVPEQSAASRGAAQGRITQPESSPLATPAADVGGLTRYTPRTGMGSAWLEATYDGEYVKFTDVLALLATKAAQEQAPTDEWYSAEDGVEHSHPSYGRGVFFTYNCAKPGFASPAPSAKQEPDDLDLQTIRERDYNADMADKLAAGIAEHFGLDIGEHSSANCPWRNALDILNTKPEFVPCAGSLSAPIASQAKEEQPEEIAGVNMARLMRNLEETNYNEGSVDLACRLSDCHEVIKALLASPVSPIPPTRGTGGSVDAGGAVPEAQAVNEFVNDYEWRTDEFCHTPTENEREMLHDFAVAFLESDLLAALPVPPTAPAEQQSAQAAPEPIAVEVSVKRNRVWIVRGNQSFMLAYEGETDEELNWYAGQLRGALFTITPCVKPAISVAQEVEQPPTASAATSEHCATSEHSSEHRGDRGDGESVDTPEFQDLISAMLKEYWEPERHTAALLTHITAWSDRRVAAARRDALEEAAKLCDKWAEEDVPGAVKGRSIRLAAAIRSLSTAADSQGEQQ
jgi:hypothetical protein